MLLIEFLEQQPVIVAFSALIVVVAAARIQFALRNAAIKSTEETAKPTTTAHHGTQKTKQKPRSTRPTPAAWSKLFPEKKRNRRNTEQRTTVVIVDVNNVRGVAGFQTGDVLAFCECAALWARDVAKYIGAKGKTSDRLRVLLAVDHGPHEAIYDWWAQQTGGTIHLGDDNNDVTALPEELAVSFAGTILTADDTIVEAVEWFLRDDHWERLTDTASMDERRSQDSYHQLLVVTTDRELRNRCQEAAARARLHSTPDTQYVPKHFGIIKSALFAEWLAGGGLWKRLYDQRKKEPQVTRKRFRGYETTRAREQQALELFFRFQPTASTSKTLTNPHTDAPLSFLSWLWGSNAKMDPAAQGNAPQIKSKSSVLKTLIEDWLEQKDTEQQEKEAHSSNGTFSKEDILTAYSRRKEEILRGVSEKMKARYVAMDCEMVGVGKNGEESALARVSIVDWNLKVVLDTYVRVPVPVTDYRTMFSGIEAHHITSNVAMNFDDCQRLVQETLRGKILVGHGLVNDLTALQMEHSWTCIRDTTRYKPFKRQNPAKKKWYRARRLRDLVREHIPGREGFQEGSHDSIDDARAVMELYQLVWKDWETEASKKGHAMDGEA